ncbi:hypothetical protein NEUTE2DRAFT_165503 [Neurospora tetrasperma FGSC 2509]|nr:hypothetical protein NEUTE2DRAFT_165503 [Neurospora tetrasperma FGSC 2509]
MGRPFDARVHLGGLEVGLERHRNVPDSVWGENDSGGLWTSVVMVEIAEGGQSRGKYQVDGDDGCMDIGDKLDDDPKDINKLGKQNSQQVTHASDGAYESPMRVWVMLTRSAAISGRTQRDTMSMPVMVWKMMGRVKMRVTLGMFVGGEDICLDGRERSEVNFNICNWKCENGMTGG